MVNSMRKRTSVTRLLVLFRPLARVLALAFICVYAAAFSCSGQSANCISVRVLDSKKGKPLKNIAITMFAVPPSSPKTVRTDSAGAARFCLTDPIPDRLWFSFDAKFESCSGYMFPSAVILGYGYLARSNQCAGRIFEFTERPKPGEIVILARHRGWLERHTEWP